jgi:glyoxylase-like metal-dependent hydrolase (beta-lactamase superfamily II)
MPSGQVPGVYRKRFGDTIVTTISDGGMPANPATLQNIELAESLAILEEARRPGPLMTAVNVFVIQSPGQTILVDTGAGTLMVPTAGRMMANLAAAGIAPDEIDAILMTHLHIDHVGGLLTADGAPAFPNADLMIPQGEIDFWFDEAQEAAAPEAKRPGFALARRTTAPYGNRMKAFSAKAPLPGIEAVALPGHTPGHTGYALGSGADRLLIWGDIMHAPEIQARRPEAAVLFDLDPALAIATRKSIMARVAEERLLVAGMHMHFPAFQYLVQAGGGYALRPIPWLTEL